MSRVLSTLLVIAVVLLAATPGYGKDGLKVGLDGPSATISQAEWNQVRLDRRAAGDPGTADLGSFPLIAAGDEIAFGGAL